MGEVFADPARAAALVAAGRGRLPAFGTAEDRFRATVRILEEMAGQP